MTVYAVRSFADLVAAVREELGVQSTDTTGVNRIKREINAVYQELTAEKNWWWLEGHTTVQLPAYISTGTVTVTQGSADITFSTAPAQSQKGKLFAVDGFNEIYIIESHTAGSTSAKLSELYAGSTTSTGTYKLFTDRIPLPTDCKETVEVWHDHHSKTLEPCGKQDFRKLVSAAPRNENKPIYYYTGDYNDPAQTSNITSLPAVSTRASAGVIKTLVFASALPSAVVAKYTAGEPLRWRIAGAGHPSYNGDIFVSSITTTTSANDTITYTGRSESQESATSDSSISVTQIDQEADYDRYRELFLYPYLSTSRITLHVDYVKEIVPLEDDDDEPVIPVQDRMVLVYGALHRGWSRLRNPEEAGRNFGLYTKKVAQMAAKLQDTFDTPKLQPSKIYLGMKRNARRRFNNGDGLYAGSSGSSGGADVITGTANSVAIYNTNGELEGSSTISTTELGYLNGVSSNIQTQLDAITTLADGKILLGNSSNEATEVTLTGDVTVSNAGVTAIASGAIVNADVNGAAAIAHSKMAALTASRAMVTDASGVASASAVTATELGYVSGVTSAIQTQMDTKITENVGAIVDADVNASAAITRSKLASGTASHVLINDGSGVMSSEASLDETRGGTAQTAVVAGDILYGSAADTWSRLAKGSDGQVLKLASGLPSWASAVASLSVSSKSADYTATTADDVLLVDASGAARTITLYAASGNSGKILHIKKTDSSANSVTVDGNASETIDGATTKVLALQYESVTIVCDGSNWYVL